LSSSGASTPPASKTVSYFYGILSLADLDYNGISSVSAHEFIECATDADNPPASGWWNPISGEEICDGAAQALTGIYTGPAGSLGVQSYYSNKHGKIIIPGLSDTALAPTTIMKHDPHANKGPGVIKDLKVFLIFWGPDWIVRTTTASTGSIMHGAMPDNACNENATTANVNNFNTLAEKNVATIYFSDWWRTSITFPQAQCDAAKQANAVPFIRMHNQKNGGATVADTFVSNANITAGTVDTALNAYADACIAFATPIVIQYGVEVNGNWMAVSAEGPTAYKSAYQHIINLFRTRGVTNVKWAVQFDTTDNPNSPSWYPGDTYIDLIGTSCYGNSNGETGNKLTGSLGYGCIGSLRAGAYSRLKAVTSANKPLGIFEWGIGESKDTTDTLTNLHKEFPDILLLQIWNEGSCVAGEWNGTINATSANLTAYKAGISDPVYTSTFSLTPAGGAAATFPIADTIIHLIKDLMCGTYASTYFGQLAQYGVNSISWGGAANNTTVPVTGAPFTDQMARNVVVDSINNGIVPPPPTFDFTGANAATMPTTEYFYYVYAPVGVTNSNPAVQSYHGWSKGQKITPKNAPNPPPTNDGLFYQSDPITPIQPVKLFTGGTTRFGELDVTKGVMEDRTINKVIFRLKKVGSPTGTLYCRLRYDSDAIVTNGEATLDVSTLTPTSTEKTFTFTNASFVFPDVGIKVLLEYYNGDANNRVEVDENDGVNQNADLTGSVSIYGTQASSATIDNTKYTFNLNKDIVGRMYSTGLSPSPSPGPNPNPDPGPTNPPTSPPGTPGPSYRIYYAWVATKNTVAGTSADPQVYASREMINLLTNPEITTGWRSGNNQLTTTCLSSMGAGDYTAYTEISNTWGSSYYSNANGSCIIPNLNEPVLTPTKLFSKSAGGRVLSACLIEQVFWGPAWPQSFSTAPLPYTFGSLDDIIQGMTNLKYFTDYFARLSQYGVQDVELDAILWNNSTTLPLTFSDDDLVKCLSDMFNPNLVSSNSSSFDPTQSVTLDPSDFPVSSPTQANFAFLIFVDSSASHKSGATSGHGYFDWVLPPQNPSTPTPVPNPGPGPVPEPTPSPPPAPGPGGGKDANGISKLYPTFGGGTEWYMNMANSKAEDDPKVKYDGINSGVSSSKSTQNGVTFYNAHSSPVGYASGGSGSTLRINVYAAGGAGSNQINTWKTRPDYLYSPQGIRNHEYTIYVRPHSKIASHLSCAYKVCGGRNDSGRSILETKYPTTSSMKVEGNWDYEHPVYVSIPNITTHFGGDWFTDNVWVGLKHVHKVPTDRKSSYNELWVSTPAFNADGTPTNNWRLKGSYTETGTSKFNGIPCTWRSQTDRVRCDGYNSIDFTYMSDREIDPNATVGTISGADSPPTFIPTSIPMDNSTGTQTDMFGVTKIYADDVTGSSWVMGPVASNATTDDDILTDPETGALITSNPNLNDDPRILTGSNKPVFTDNMDGSWKAKSSEVRLDIVQNNPFTESSLTLNQATLSTQGYMQDTKDWGANGRGIEATAYYRINAHSSSTVNGESHIEHVLGGAVHTSDTSTLNGFPKTCEGCTYHANVYPITGRCKFEKELSHTAGYSTGDPEATNTSYKFIDSKKWVGWKTVKYVMADGQSVKLEAYIDINATNNWVKVLDFVDNGKWGPTQGKIGATCGGGENTVITWGGPIFGFRWDNITDMDIKWASVRSINPLNNIQQPNQPNPPTPIIDPTPSIAPGVPIMGPNEGPGVNIPNLSPGAPVETPVKDIFGVKNLYPSAQSGELWTMSKNGLFGDHRIIGIPKGQAEIRNSDGSFHLQTPKAQFYITVYVTTIAGYNFAAAGGLSGNHTAWKTRGYMMDQRDWRNVEITFFHRMRQGINTDGGQDAGAGIIARSGLEQIGPPNCQGCAYRCSAVIDARQVTGFDKEQWFSQYAPTQLGPTYSQMNVSAPVDRFVGRKFVLFNVPNASGDTIAVHIEHWWNDNADGVSWVKIQEYTDSGGWGSFGATCGGDIDQILSWGGPLVGFHWKNINGLDYKYLSVREIDPAGHLPLNVPGVTTVGPGPSTPTDINPAPKPPLVLPLLGSSIFNLSKHAYGVIYNETGGCNVGLTAGQQGATKFYISATSNTGIALYTGNVTRAGEQASTSSIMIGKLITEVDVYLKGAGSPTGTITVTIRKASDDSVAATMGTMQATQLTGTMTLYSFVNTGNAYTIVLNDKVLVEYNSGDVSNNVIVDKSNASTVDGIASAYVSFAVGGTTTPYSQTTDGASIHMYSGSKVRVGEKVVNTTSVIYNKILGQVDVYGARATTSVTGSCYVRIRKGTDDTVAFEFPVHDITEFCQTGSICPTPISFVDNTNTYALQVGDKVLFEFGGGSSTNYFRAADDNGTAPVDGTNTTKVFYTTSYTEETGNDTMMVMKAASGAGTYTMDTAKDLEGNMWSGNTGGGGGTGGGVTSTKVYSVDSTHTPAILDSDTADFQRAGVVVNTSDSILFGQKITQVDAWLDKDGSPTGTVTCNIRKGLDDTVAATIGTLDITTLGTTMTLKTFTNTANTYAMQTGDKILIEYSGGSSGVDLGVDKQSQNVVDGSNTCFVTYKTTGAVYTVGATKEWCGNLWIGSGSGGTGGQGGQGQGSGGGALTKIYDVTKITKDTDDPNFVSGDIIDHWIRISEKITNTSSSIYNKVIREVDLYLARVGSPTGTATVCIRDSSSNIMTTLGTIDVSTIVQSTTDYVLYVFSNTTSTYATQSGDRISFEFSGGDVNNYIRIAIDDSDPVDSSNTKASFFDDTWASVSFEDLCGTMWA
jgi:hypothetical protein